MGLPPLSSEGPKKLYTTQPPILTLRAIFPGLGTAHTNWLLLKSAHRLAVGPWALDHHNPRVCNLACRWRLKLALLADQEYFSIETHPLCLIVEPYATTPSCPTAFVINISLCKVKYFLVPFSVLFLVNYVLEYFSE